MTLLKRFRLSPRWLVLLVGFAALAVTSAALMPHDDGNSEDFDCLVCKVGHQPLTELSAVLVAEPPLTLTSKAPSYRALHIWAPLVEPGSPRAPPA
jgi:hypothetical protein